MLKVGHLVLCKAQIMYVMYKSVYIEPMALGSVVLSLYLGSIVFWPGVRSQD